MRAALQRAAQQAHLLLQQQHFEQVADGFGVADDVVADRLGAVAGTHAQRSLEDRQFLLRMFRVAGADHAQRARVVQQLHQQLLLGGLVQAGVVRSDAGGGQQLGDDFLVLVRTLTQVYCCQVETEYLDRAHQRAQPLRRQGRAMVLAQRLVDGAQVGQQFLSLRIGVLRRHGVAGGVASAEILQRGGQAGVDAGQRAAVGFVLAVLVGVGRALGQSLHLRRNIDQPRRQRQLAAEVMHFRQQMAQRHVGLALERVLQRLRADVRVAVAVAAYPLAHFQEAGDVLVAQLGFQRRVQLGDFAQKGGLVIAERGFHLVGHAELGEAQQTRLPQLHHAGANLSLVGGQLDRRQRITLTALHTGLDVVARHQQLGDAALGVQNALALHFGRVCCQHRRHMALGQGVGNGPGRDAGPAQACQRHLDAAFLGVTGTLVKGAAADVVAVLGQVGQVAEIGEGADHADRLVAAQALEQLFQRAVGFLVGVAPERNRQLADLFDQFVGLAAFLLANHIAQQTAEQPDVVDQRLVLVDAAARRGRGGCGVGRGGGHDCVHQRFQARGMLASPARKDYRQVTKCISSSPPAKVAWPCGRPNMSKHVWRPWATASICWA